MNVVVTTPFYTKVSLWAIFLPIRRGALHFTIYQMLKFIRKSAMVLMVSLFLFSFTTNVFAADQMDITRKAIGDIQKIVDSNGLNATVTQLDRGEYQRLWNQRLAPQESVIAFLDRLKFDGFKEIAKNENMAVKIVDNKRTSLSVDYFSKVYQNSLGEKVVALLVYDPQTNNILRIFSEKIDTNNQVDLYYEFSESNPLMTRAKNGDFNTLSFLCGLTGTVACGSFSAMLFAFVPASIAVGMTCSAAFAYVCSYA